LILSKRVYHNSCCGNLKATAKAKVKYMSSGDITTSAPYKKFTQTISKRVDIKAALMRNAAKIPIDFVLPGLPTGVVGLLASPGATGKSMLALRRRG
jgi:hypothetical protein